MTNNSIEKTDSIYCKICNKQIFRGDYFYRVSTASFDEAFSMPIDCVDACCSNECLNTHQDEYFRTNKSTKSFSYFILYDKYKARKAFTDNTLTDKQIKKDIVAKKLNIGHTAVYNYLKRYERANEK